MERGLPSQEDLVMDSVVFQRGVYYMEGFGGLNGSVVDTQKDSRVNCTLMKFQGTELYNISSVMSPNEAHSHDNNTFLCMSLWPNGTTAFSALGTHVKCMTQNSRCGCDYF